MFKIYARHNISAAALMIQEIEDKINALSTAWDNATDTRKRNKILAKMNELSAKLETLEAI